jgi:hypothetical protein
MAADAAAQASNWSRIICTIQAEPELPDLD